METSEATSLDGRLDRLRLQHSTWMDEYKALRAEIAQTLTSARQGTQISVIALTALISSTGYIVQNDLPVAFLVEPFIFYALAWTQLRFIYTIRSLSDYILKNITVGVHWTLRQISPTEYPENQGASRTLPREPLQWDEVVRHRAHAHKLRLWLIEAAHFVIPLTTAALLPLGYIAYTVHYRAPISEWCRGYIIINELFFVYTVMLGGWMQRFHQGLNDPDNPVPYRFCDLVPFWLLNMIGTWTQGIFNRKKAVQDEASSPPCLSWYRNTIKPGWLFVYRCSKIALFVSIGWGTWTLVDQYNLSQQHIAKINARLIKLTSGQIIHGDIIEFDNRNYVVTIKTERLLIDGANIAKILPWPPSKPKKLPSKRSSSTQSFTKRGMHPGRNTLHRNANKKRTSTFLRP